MHNYFNEQLEVLQNILHPGHMVMLNIRNLEEGQDETIFVIKETADILNAIPKDPDIHTCGTTFSLNDVAVPIIYIAVHGIEECLYESVINYYTPDEDGEKILSNLSKQENICLCFMSDRPSIDRVIKIENGLKEMSALTDSTIRQYFPRWSMPAFDRAKRQILNRYPGRSLFDQLINNEIKITN